MALGGTGLGVSLAHHRHHLHPPFPEPFRHLDRDMVGATRRDHQGRVLRRDVEVPQNPRRKTLHVLEIHGLALAVRTGGEIVKGQRKLHDRIPTRKRPVTRPHLLHHDAAVPGAEEMHQPPPQNRLRKPVRGAIDGILLSRHRRDHSRALAEIIFARIHVFIAK